MTIITAVFLFPHFFFFIPLKGSYATTEIVGCGVDGRRRNSQQKKNVKRRKKGFTTVKQEHGVVFTISSIEKQSMLPATSSGGYPALKMLPGILRLKSWGQLVRNIAGDNFTQSSGMGERVPVEVVTGNWSLRFDGCSRCSRGQFLIAEGVAHAEEFL
ncbi:uncharacterized protein LOC135168020 [Diachasmimorpha longicaudata]|uniref:uncharacterized protein LOC135168020 n=1 Tax=Diachasmimorpha longicaudata TaxID=58733 RepID=UPI0030B88350